MQAGKWQIPETLLYTHDNFWVKLEGNQALVGLTEYGQYTIGDVLYLELVSPGTELEQGGSFGSVESGKWVGSLVAPVSGVVMEINSELETDPRKVNSDPYGQGWMIKVRLNSPEDADGLMDAAAYAQWVEEQVRREMEDEVVL
ncbi:MAG TPA: glycine cleavage system protein GcvH [Syntrophomonadaceae bacterium]|nr:glycine cleavage system protein GcvH [Syntrophomonadaceae bacterium]HOQ10208.1 glycine cleavage system protein GcvH [Syntrophomonadaceae bacterium]HPU49335.1 glycine cleavage system protein GcvH [Syntrophomonadaceae bacterium]